MQELLAAFVPVADEVHRLQNSGDVEGLWFRGLSEAGHYAGRTAPTDTRQGIYAATPAGELLVSRNTTRRDSILELLRGALQSWEGKDRAARLGAPPAGDPPRRPEARYPAGGLALVVHARDLNEQQAAGDWRAAALNRDRAWFTADEARAFVPEASVGAKRAIAPDLLRRIARLHLVDFVRGQTSPFRPEDVQQTSMEARVTAVSEASVEIEFQGRFRMEGAGLPEGRPRGYAPLVLGRASWDPVEGRFRAFEWVAAGPRWGATKYNGRSDDLEPRAMGLVFRLAKPGDRVPPAFVWAYGR